MMWHDVMYIKASTQCDGSFLVAFVQGNVRLLLLFFPPSPPSSRVACDIYVMADFILVEAVSEADGCSGLLMWTLVCACDLWCICFLVVELVFLWVFFQSFPPMFFLPLFFSPARMLGGILLNLIPVCPQLLLFVCGVMVYVMGHSYVVTVAFVQLCEEMLEREGMERKEKCGFWEAFVHFTSMQPPISVVRAGLTCNYEWMWLVI